MKNELNLKSKEKFNIDSLRNKIISNPMGYINVSESELDTLILLVNNSKSKLSQHQINMCKNMGILPNYIS